jgi:hypothetical protein
LVSGTNANNITVIKDMTANTHGGSHFISLDWKRNSALTGK